MILRVFFYYEDKNSLLKDLYYTRVLPYGCSRWSRDFREDPRVSEVSFYNKNQGGPVTEGYPLLKRGLPYKLL